MNWRAAKGERAKSGSIDFPSRIVQNECDSLFICFGELYCQTTRRAKITALGTYVPPRVLTNKDLEKMVDTTDQWILERTGIRERHLVDKGVAASDLAVEAVKKLVAVAPLRSSGSGCDRGRHRHSRHDVSLDGVPGATQTRHRTHLGLRRFGGMLGLRVCAERRHPVHRVWPGQEGAGDRRRRELFHDRLHRSRGVHHLRRRRGRRAAGTGGRG